VIDSDQSNPSEPELQDLESAQSAESAADPFQGISSNRLEAAFQYVERGLAIFPCEPCSKRPSTPHGFKDASTKLRPYNHHPSLKGFAEFFLPDGSELPVNAQENWAIEPGRAGFTVIDIDPKNGGNKSWAELVALHGRATTRVVSTPSGGWHLWFRGTLPRVNRKLGPGIDTRCLGGYVLLPPSTVLFDDPRRLGHYAWDDDTVPIAPLPAWIVEEIEAAAAREAEIRSELRDQLRDQACNGAGGDAFESWLSLIGDHEGGLGFYDPMLRAAGAGVALGMPADEILDRLRETVEAADRRNHSLAEIRDRLSKMPGAIRKFQANDAARLRNEQPEEEEEPSEPEEPLEEPEPEEEEEEPVKEAEEEEEEEEEEPDVEEPGEPDEPEAEEEDTGARYTENLNEEEPEADPIDPEPLDHKEAVRRAEQKLCQSLQAVFDTPLPIHCLFNATMGLGKTTKLITLLALLSDPTHPDPISRAEREAANLKYNHYVDPLDVDLGTIDGMPTGLPPGQILYIAQRHDLLLAAETQLKDDLRQRGWSEEAIERNVVILAAREHQWLDREGNEIRKPQCGRPEVINFIKAAGSSYSISASACQQKDTEIRCPLYDSCEWQQAQRKAPRARFVLMTHAHLTTPFGPPHTFEPEKPPRPPDRFHPQNADMVIIDEDFISTMIDRPPQHFTAGTFCRALPPDAKIKRRLPTPWVEQIGLPGSIIEDALKQPEANQRAWLREHGVTRKALWRAVEYCQNRESSKRPLGHPAMSMAERQATLKAAKPEKFPRISQVLQCLSRELYGSGRINCLTRDLKTGNITFRARPLLWDTSLQKVVVLDGTASVEELRLFIPKIKEVRIDVPRNAISIQVCDATYSKWTTVTGSKEKGFRPKLQLKTAWEFIQRFVQAAPTDEKPAVGGITTKTIRRALQHEGIPAKPEDKFEVAAAFQGTLLGHYRNVRGSNDFKGCSVGFLIGRDEIPVTAIEDDTRALHFDAPTPIKCVKPDWKGNKRLVSEPAVYTLKNGTTHKRSKGATYHPDRRAQLRNAATREKEMLQGTDRFRLVHNEEPKLIFTFSSVPLAIPVDVLITELAIKDALKFAKLIDRAEAPQFRGTVPLCSAWLHKNLREEWSTEQSARRWVERLLPSQDPELRIEKGGCEPLGLIEYIISLRTSDPPLKISPLDQALTRGWNVARYRISGTKAAEWSLFIYRGDRPSRVSLASHLEAAPENLEFRTLAGEPLAAAEDPGPATGNALLDQALALCAAGNMALALAPEALAALPGSPFRNAQQAKDWKKGATVKEILTRGPPDGWSGVAYRLRARRGGKPTEAWIPPGLEPLAAIAATLNRPPEDIIVLPQEETRRWRKPHIVEEPFSDPTEFIVMFGGKQRAWPPHVAPQTKPLSFLDLLQPEEREGVLLTAELCGEPNASAARPSSFHGWIH
jgi:hypothetical protein